jgi:hypothetical protein
MDGGLQIENALRHAVIMQKDYYGFADTARVVAITLGLNDKERDKIFGALADSIAQWDNYGTKNKDREEN